MKWHNSGTVRFFVSALISTGPFIVRPNLFFGDIGLSETITFIFWFLALVALATYARLQSLNENLRIFLSIVLGFASGYFAWSVLKLMEYPVPIDIYVRTFVGPSIFSSIAATVGLGSASAIRKLRENPKLRKP